MWSGRSHKTKVIFNVREPILPIRGSLTFRINKILEKMESYDLLLQLPLNQEPEIVHQTYCNAQLMRTKVPIPRTGILTKYVASLLFGFETANMLSKEARKSSNCVFYGYGASAAIALGLSGVRMPCVLDIFETELPFVMSEKFAYLRGPGKTIEKYLFSVANRPECKIVVLTEAIKNYILTKYDTSPDIHVIYDTTDPNLFSMQDYDSKIVDPALIFMGDIYYRDGVDKIIEALPIVIKEVPNIKLYLLGDGPDRSRVLDISHRMGLEKHVAAPGWLPFKDVIRLLPKMMIGLAPGSPMLMNKLVIPRKVFEYMSAGVVTVASNFEANREVIINNESGLLVNPLNVEEFAESIVRLLSDKKLYNHLQFKARKIVEELSVEREIGRLTNLIMSAM